MEKGRSVGAILLDGREVRIHFLFFSLYLFLLTLIRMHTIKLLCCT